MRLISGGLGESLEGCGQHLEQKKNILLYSLFIFFHNARTSRRLKNWIEKNESVPVYISGNKKKTRQQVIVRRNCIVQLDCNYQLLIAS